VWAGDRLDFDALQQRMVNTAATVRRWPGAFKSSGVEGLVVKGASTRYQPGRRDRVKVNSVGVGGVRQLACALTGLVRRWIVVVRT